MGGDPNTARRVLLAAQHLTGVCNASSAIYSFNTGVYWVTFISLVAVLVTACWRVPAYKPPPPVRDDS